MSALEAEYEELLEKTIRDEETSNVDVTESMAELKNKLEAQYAAKKEAHLGEVADLKQQLELKGTEVRSLNAAIDSLKGVNEELKVCSFILDSDHVAGASVAWAGVMIPHNLRISWRTRCMHYILSRSAIF